VAVTGSNGKTTVKRMIHHVLSRRLKGSASPKSFNNAVGVPLTLLAAAPEDDYLVCEIGTSAPGEVAALGRIARPDLAVITSVSETHLERLLDLEHVAAEKAALLGELSGDGLAVIWSDSEPLARAVRPYPVRQVRFGVREDADLRLTGYWPRPGGGRFELNGRLTVELGVAGRCNALNALAAIAAAQRFGFTQEEASSALADYRGEEMRLQLLEAGAVTIVNDAYNANPASVQAAAEALGSFAGRRKVLVIGDMLELGARSVQLHRATGEALARSGAGLIVGVGALGQEVAAAAAAAGAAAEQIQSVEAAAEVLPRLLKRGDLVLLKGSRRMGMERLAEPIRRHFYRPRPAPARRGKAPTC
jgi:UDP-N-acetylmuramoyl-tripeptide--D-alanyl-D-alanine ligase